ncbi:ferredoxin [Nocardia sp. BSTN01]|uniref:ferredoxin n=1 Tax=Nocardia sp. BSTN01 TaxID=2783665 RepID=UPI00189045D7|nr:ferredoxin [Nocardia sp. BSTN01]MBF5000500.1 ferredoxin [Nocardia sp. BSTN01]
MTVDAGRCAGHGICEALVAEVFVLDGTGRSTVRAGSISEADRLPVEQAVACCPAQAISFSEDE